MLSEYEIQLKTEPWRRWYRHAHWKRLRTLVLARDPICKRCNRYPSTIADHIKPHKGLWELFCDLANLQGLCKKCHDEKTANEDGGFGRSIEQKKERETSTTVGKDAIDEALKDIDAIADLEV